MVAASVRGYAMKLPRRKFLHLSAGAGALPVAARIAKAQTYPTRPVRLIVGFSAGGPLDTGARLIAQALMERLGQSFLVENHPGASSNLAAEEVVRARPDGYTLLVCAAANSWNVQLYKNLAFDFSRDIAAVASFERGVKCPIPYTENYDRRPASVHGQSAK